MFNYKFNTFLLRFSSDFSKFNEHSESLFLTSSFSFLSAYNIELFFKNFDIYNIYSRFSNPNLSMLQKKIFLLEGNKFCLILASGMSSIVSIFITFLTPGDSFISLNNIFGSTLNFFLIILFKFNIIVKLINSFNINFWLKSFIFNTKLFYLETPSNPLMGILDLKILSYITKFYNILLVVDNTLCTFVTQSLFKLDIDIILYSCTKFLEGQGRILGGAILCKNNFLIKEIFYFIRLSGITISAFNAWLIFKSLETLVLRIKFQIKNILILLDYFKNNSFIFKIFYPCFFDISKKNFFDLQQISGSSLFSFLIKSSFLEMKRINSWKIINYNKILSITANLGDVKTILIQPSISTHYSLSYIEKKILCIDENLLRLSLGIEDIFDIYNNIILGFKKFNY